MVVIPSDGHIEKAELMDNSSIESGCVFGKRIRKPTHKGQIYKKRISETRCKRTGNDAVSVMVKLENSTNFDVFDKRLEASERIGPVKQECNAIDGTVFNKKKRRKGASAGSDKKGQLKRSLAKGG